MARSRGVRQNFNFVKGWNTEASPMTFPENTAKDLDNVILDIDGSIRRRPGVNFDDLDASFADTSTTSRFSTEAIGFFAWLNVAGQGTTAFTVTQFGTTLYFHRQAGPETVNNLIGSIDISSFTTNLSAAKNELVSVASGMGYLFVVGKFLNPFYIEYNPATDALSTTAVNIEIRDFDGLDDGLAISERPTTLSDEHHYNLLNQGWVNEGYKMSLENRGSSTINFVTIGNPIQSTFDEEQLGFYPSNADVMHLCKLTAGDSVDVIGAYRPFILEDLVLGNTRAPLGHFILGAFNKQRGAVSGVGVGSETTSTRPSTVGFHNGRVFYAGLSELGKTGEVYFSQQLTNIKKVGRCYQEQDPTAEDFNELLETDGGVIPIPNAGTILNIQESAAGIVVFATNGVWEIAGVDGKFSATSFFVRKITDIGVSGKETVVNADGVFIFWSDAGIIALSQDQVTGHLNAENISKNTIQTGYLLIGGVQRKFARGVYITEEKKAVWLYNTSTSYNGSTDRWKLNGVLVLDTQLGAFYKYSVSDLNAGAAPYIAGIIKTNPFISTEIQENVTENGVIVTENGVNVTVGVEAFDGDSEISSWKLLCVRTTFGTGGTNLGLAFGEFNSRTWSDWFLSDGVGAGYTSFLETGYAHEGNPTQDKKPTYVFAYLSPKSKSLLSGSYYELPETPEFFCGDLSTMTYTGRSFDVATETSNSFALSIKDDGTRLFVYDRGTATVYQYDLSTAFDVSTAVYAGVSFSVAAQVTDAHSMTVVNGGSRMYITSNVSDIVYQYSMSADWDLSTAVYDSKFFDFTAQSPDTYDVAFKNDGTRCFVVDASTEAIYQYTLSTAWDISTASYDSVSFSITAQSDEPHAMRISSDGKRLYVLELTDNNIYQYELSTAYDLATASFAGISFSATTEATDTHGFDLSTDGLHAYVVNGTAGSPDNTIFEYEITCS